MKVGWVGLGKLGLPCALALEHFGGHEVIGYDTNPGVVEIIQNRSAPRVREAGLEGLLQETNLEFATDVVQVVQQTDRLVFVAVQTPHDLLYGGEGPMPDQVQDFDYQHLCAAVSQIAAAAQDSEKSITLVVVSTALPGTMQREIEPLLNEFVDLVYNPFFIAMGTTIADFQNPEFVLVGARSDTDVTPLTEVYEKLYERQFVPILKMELDEAELTKVAYNTFISMKIVFANTINEICHKIGADSDVVTGALVHGWRRLMSDMYLTGGMGDGGACHPRDNIAMSWLAQQLQLSVDPFAFVTRAREAQSAWLAQEIRRLAEEYDLPVIMLGKSYKPQSGLMAGSPALLLDYHLDELGIQAQLWDPYVDQLEPAYVPQAIAIYVIATKHKEFTTFEFPEGSVVVDPHRYILPRSGVTIIPIGGEPK